MNPTTLGLLSLAPLAVMSPAQPDALPANAGASLAAVNSPRHTMVRLQKQVTIEFADARLDAVVHWLAEATGARLEPIWKSDKNGGLDRDLTISLSADGLSAQDVLKKLVQRLSIETGDDTSWQLTADGAVQIGAKQRLNRFKRVEVYDIADLLLSMPINDRVPEIDLQAALQGGGGGKGGRGGGGGTPIHETRQNPNRDESKTKDQRAEELVALITKFVEQPQWTVNGGDGGQLVYYQGHLIVEAPDYMHRAVNGYPWWPRSKPLGVRRYLP